MYKVVYLPTARRQLEEAVMYIAFDLADPGTAQALADGVDTIVFQLREMPYRYPIYHSLYAMKNEIRSFPVKNYNVYYTIDEVNHTVEILRVLHYLRRQ